VRGCELHLFVDGGGAAVERTAKEVRKAEAVVHLIGVVGSSGGDNDVLSHLFRERRVDLGVGVCERKHDWIAAH